MKFPLLKKDGTLVYSTCTICPDENNLLIERFIEKNKTLKLVSQRQILPSLDYPGDGFYSAIISYKSEKYNLFFNWNFINFRYELLP